jgi:hypothetical protein
MAPTHRGRKDMLNKASAIRDSLKDLNEQICAQIEAMRYMLRTTYMPLATRMKECLDKVKDDQTPALHGFEHQLQKVMENPLALLPNSVKDSGDLKDKALVRAIEMLEENENKTCAVYANTEKLASVLQQVHHTTQVHNMLDTNIFPNAPGNNITHDVNLTNIFLGAAGNMTNDMEIECRFRGVNASHIQAN